MAQVSFKLGPSWDLGFGGGNAGNKQVEKHLGGHLQVLGIVQVRVEGVRDAATCDVGWRTVSAALFTLSLLEEPGWGLLDRDLGPRAVAWAGVRD